MAFVRLTAVFTLACLPTVFGLLATLASWKLLRGVFENSEMHLFISGAIQGVCALVAGVFVNIGMNKIVEKVLVNE